MRYSIVTVPAQKSQDGILPLADMSPNCDPETYRRVTRRSTIERSEAVTVREIPIRTDRPCLPPEISAWCAEYLQMLEQVTQTRTR